MFEQGTGICGREVAEKERERLRELGGVFMHLKAEINWHRLFHELIEGFDPDALHKRQTKALKKFDLPLP